MQAKVVEIQMQGSLHIVSFELSQQILRMMSLELPPNFRVGSNVKLYVKPTHIALGKGVVGEISFASQLQVKVVAIEQGKLLSSVTLCLADEEFEAVVSTSFIQNIKIGDEVVAFIKASELLVEEVLDV